MHGTVRRVARDAPAPPYLRKVGQGYIFAVFAVSRTHCAGYKKSDTYSVSST